MCLRCLALILHLHPYAPHRDTRLALPATGLVTIHGANGSGKSSLVESYAAAHWGRSLRGASPWRSPDCRIAVEHPCGLRVERTPTDLLVNNAGALKPSKKQPDLTALVGDFATWQRTRVFDADLTARFGAATDGDRKKLLEQLLDLEKLDDGLRRCREDKREIERQLRACEQSLYIFDVPAIQAHTKFDAQALEHASALLVETERRIAEISREEGRLAAEQRGAEQRLHHLRGGNCPTCEQAVPAALRQRLRESAAEAQVERAATEARLQEARQENAGLLAQVRQLRGEQAAAERAKEDARRRDEQAARRAPIESQRSEHAATLRRLGAVEAFIVAARPKLLKSSLAILEAAASAWLPELAISEDGAIRHGMRTYKELNEGHRRLCDLAVLLGLSSLGDAEVKGAIWLDGALHGLDEDRQDAVAALLETVAQRELVIVLTCVEETARRQRGMQIRVADGRCEVIR